MADIYNNIAAEYVKLLMQPPPKAKPQPPPNFRSALRQSIEKLDALAQRGRADKNLEWARKGGQAFQVKVNGSTIALTIPDGFIDEIASNLQGYAVVVIDLAQIIAANLAKSAVKNNGQIDYVEAAEAAIRTAKQKFRRKF